MQKINWSFTVNTKKKESKSHESVGEHIVPSAETSIHVDRVVIKRRARPPTILILLSIYKRKKCFQNQE